MLFEKIKEQLNKSRSPLFIDELFAMLPDSEHISYNEYASALDALEKKGELFFTKKGKVASPEVLGFIKCRFRSSARGFGFASPFEDEKNEIFIPRNDVCGAIDGDTVFVGIKKPKNAISSGERPEGYVVCIVERSLKKIIGTLFKTHARKKRMPIYYVVPDSKRIAFETTVAYENLNGAEEGDKVELEITSYPDERHPARGKITTVFGESDSKDANYSAILHSYGIRTEFPEEVMREAKEVCTHEVVPADRIDLRNTLIFTIDGADSKDLDDAISVEKTQNGFILGVHIADVSHYVRENTCLDKEAIERATSVYFTDKVVPMLPKELSNGICSLNPGEDRYALSAFITLDSKGEIENTEIKESVINSKIRGVYSELNDVIENRKSSAFSAKYEALNGGALDDMLTLFKILESKSRKRGMLELESTESKILLDENGQPKDIFKRERGISEQIIEQFMLCANEAVASWLFWQDMPCVYRVHDDPDEEKIKSFAIFAQNLGVDVSPLNTKNLHPTAIRKVMEDAKHNNVSDIASRVLLRCLAKAKYSSDCRRHFGLSLERYCHFTSPIRRYPDLATHRMVKLVLHGGIDETNIGKYNSFVNTAALISSEKEKDAMGAERDIDDLYKTLFMRNYIGQTFDAVITSVTGFGFFAELENTCEGLVSVSSLEGYFEFDEKSLTLYKGKEKYTLGQKVRISVKDADVITRRVDFELTE